MLFVYINTITRRFIEFSFNGENIKQSESPVEYFLKTIEDGIEMRLPKELALQLEDSEIDVFLLAKYSERIKSALQKMLFVVHDKKKLYDQFGNEYRVEYENDSYIYVSKEDGGGFHVFYIDSECVKEGGVFDAEALDTASF